jgi:L-cysteine S-thiosulfotransferase
MSNRTGPRPRRVCAPAWLGLALALMFGHWPVGAQTPAGLQAFKVVDDGILEPLGGLPGDPARGRKLVASRQPGLCLLCHSGPFPEEPFQGNLAPDLSGTGARWSVAQLRLRLVDSRRVHPDSIMPAYHRTDGLTNVGAAWKGQPILSAQQIEDVVAFLATLN